MTARQRMARMARRSGGPARRAENRRLPGAAQVAVLSAHAEAIGPARQLKRICEGVADLPVPRQSVPPAGAFLEQTVRAWHTAGHSQQAIARELSIDRRKAPRAHEAERRPATAP